MKRGLGFLILCTFLCFSVKGQKVLWAHKVIDYSSERKTPIHLAQIEGSAYKAVEVLGKPDIFPGVNGNSRAWTPKSPNKVDFIKVSFKEPIQAQQLVILETFNTTAVWKVYLYDPRGNEYLINEFDPRPIPLQSRLLDILFEKTKYKVVAAKIVLNGSVVPGYNGIDAIAISDSKDPISIDIPEADGIYEGLIGRKLGPNINSPYKDLRPLLSVDNKSLYFSRVQDPNNMGGSEDLEDIWVSNKDQNGEWQKAQNIGEVLNNKGPNFISSISAVKGGQLMLLGNKYRKNRMLPGVSVVYDLDSGLTRPQTLIIENDENFSPFANYFLGPNQDVLLMSVQRRVSYGGRDLYVSFLKDNGKWSTPKNLGKTINTSDEDFAPFLAQDGKTLYFSSKGHLGFGGSDIYITKRLDNSWTNWTEPENLGPTINSELDDMFFVLSTDHKYAYYTKGDGKDADIYYLQLPIYQLPEPVVRINVRIINQETSELVPFAKLKVFNHETNEVVFSQMGDSTGGFSMVLSNGLVYEIKAEAEDFLSVDSHIIDLNPAYESDTLNYDLNLIPIEKGIRVPLSNIYFEFDKAKLKPESFPQLDKVFEFMDKNQKVEIQLDGHTCSIGSENYNQVLSEQRAQAVKDYIVKKGIKSKRLLSLGFGETMPKAENSTEVGREINRRVEFVILSE